MDESTRAKALIVPLRAAMYDFDERAVRRCLGTLLKPDAVVHLCCPFGSVVGPEALYDAAYRDLFAAIPDLERRDTIVMAGPDEQGASWIGCGGYYTGSFERPWLDIPPTGHQVGMRFHEFYRVEQGRVVEVQAVWDIPEVMMQASAWPLAPSLGREWQVPAPATQDGIVPGPYDAEASLRSRQLVSDMLAALKRHPAHGGPEMMELDRYWHPRMSWYGPSGIGTGRGIAGFRNWHQIPFLAAMPDRGQHGSTRSHLFADGTYVAITGWPNMRQTLLHGGWLGLPRTGTMITLRSLDFWRVERDLIRENWVLIDLLDVYGQLGLDVFARLREFNKARSGGQALP
ncbi:MAG TPA: ester cyclase [Microvirga sp.]|nr:ester cyclase [Microvirga sp.]